MIRQPLNPTLDMQTNVKPEAFHANAIVVCFGIRQLVVCCRWMILRDYFPHLLIDEGISVARVFTVCKPMRMLGKVDPPAHHFSGGL